MRRQRPWAIGLAIVSVLLLAYPSAVAVYRWLEPIRGKEAAFSAAAGIELTYLSLACLYFFTDRLKAYAFRLQLWAVLTAVLLNSVESYSKRKGIDISTGLEAARTFDLFLLCLSIGESIPLAGLAFGVSMVLHSLVVTDQPADPRMASLLKQYDALTYRPWLDRARSLLRRVRQWLPRRPERRQDSPNVLDPSELLDTLFPAVSEPPGLSEEQVSEIRFEPIDPEVDVVEAQPQEAEQTSEQTALVAELRTTTDPNRRKSIRRTLRERYRYYLSEDE